MRLDLRQKGWLAVSNLNVLTAVLLAAFILIVSSSSSYAQRLPANLNWGKKVSNASDNKPPVPWKEQFHPDIKAHTQFELQAAVDGDSWLKISADKAYGSWAYSFGKPGAVVQNLSWQWRVEQHPTGANLRTKQGDDTAVKVCVFIAVDEGKISLTQRMALGAARTLSGQDLPAATLCYVWVASGEEVGKVFDNPYTNRVKNIVLRAQEAGLSANAGSFTETRNIQIDARKAFGAELPDGDVRLLGLAVGGDSDNTQSKSVGYVRSIRVK
ncbi:MAG: DUF3047 domain-containing protein [Limnobacter sp.]|nr:DUF3047 domain-containing protein [Limnobacter sp.]